MKSKLSYAEIHSLIHGAKLMDHDLPHLKVLDSTIRQFAFGDEYAIYVGSAGTSAQRIKEEVAMSIYKYHSGRAR